MAIDKQGTVKFYFQYLKPWQLQDCAADEVRDEDRSSGDEYFDPADIELCEADANDPDDPV